MPGILADQMQGAQAPLDPSMAGADPSAPPDAGAGAPGDDSQADAQQPDLTITPQTVMEHLHLQPPQVPQLQRIIVAGMKVMFSQQTHQMMLDEIKKPGDMATKLGQSTAGLLGLLMKESQNSLPPNLLIPAGLVLMAHAAEYMNKTGAPVGDQELSQGMNVFIQTMLKQFGLDPAKVQQMAGDATQAPDDAGNDPTAAPTDPTAAAPAQGAPA